ncbi:MAG: hypothetical protein M3P12_13160 [Gemmatimonadota bacterium]|nr:hypothetical protein [Gemmatimonadota bacterium]
MTQYRSPEVIPIENRIENGEANVIIRAEGAQVVEMEERGIIIHAAGVNAVRRSEATGLV